MAKAGAAGRVGATAGRAAASAGAQADAQVSGFAVAALFIGAAFVIAWTAGKYARPGWVTEPFTETESAVHDFESHLAHPAELLTAPAMLPHAYPDRTAPGITSTMHQGFTQQWRAPSIAVAANPSEAEW